jgi:hypothetical protein
MSRILSSSSTDHQSRSWCDARLISSTGRKRDLDLAVPFLEEGEE